MAIRTWTSISDLPEDWEDLARPDLGELLRQWQEERRYATEPGRARLLHERLANLWAIETGVVEHLYTVDRGTASSLVELGLDGISQFSQVGRLTANAAHLIEDQRAALDFACSYAEQGQPLSPACIRELHKLLMRHSTPGDAPDQRRNGTHADRSSGDAMASSNPGVAASDATGEALPSAVVDDELNRLLTLHRRHLELGVCPAVEAAWLHHRFTQLQPFEDGNGRVARALAAMTFVKAGCVPLVIRDDIHRDAYIDALGEADAGDLKPLVDLFANVVSADLNDAITFIRSARGRDFAAIATAAANAARRAATHDERALRRVTDHYRKLAGNRFRDVAGLLTRAFSEALPHLKSAQHAWIIPDDQEVRQGSGARGRWREQLVHAASEYGYAPDLSQYKRWVALKLPGAAPDAQRWHIVMSLHHKHSRAEVVAAVVFLTVCDEADAGTLTTESAQPAILGSKHEFTHSGSHPHDERFLAWLDTALLSALEEWQARI